MTTKLENLNRYVDKALAIAGEDGVVYYNGDSSALILLDDGVIGVNHDGSISRGQIWEWDTLDSGETL